MGRGLQVIVSELCDIFYIHFSVKSIHKCLNHGTRQICGALAITIDVESIIGGKATSAWPESLYLNFSKIFVIHLDTGAQMPTYLVASAESEAAIR